MLSSLIGFVSTNSLFAAGVKPCGKVARRAKCVIGVPERRLDEIAAVGAIDPAGYCCTACAQMKKLPRYLIGNFTRESIAMFAVVLALVWVMQVLRLFDLITAKGQDVATLMGQAVLLTPPLARTLLYIAMGVGIARVLRRFQDTRELHIIHTSARVGAIWSGILWFSFAGMVLVALMANWLEPLARQSYAHWSAKVTADLVGRALKPDSFREIAPGLVVEIGGRGADGKIEGFFAQDNRDPDAQKTFQAQSATIVSDEAGYYLDLRDGSVQYVRKKGGLSELQFSSYQLSIDRLSTSSGTNEGLASRTSMAIVNGATDGTLSPAEWFELDQRFSEPLRLFALCLLVGALTAFPSGRRNRGWFPMEVAVLVFGLLDRLLNNIVLPPMLGHSLGAAIMFCAALGIMGWRLYGFRAPMMRVRGS